MGLMNLIMNNMAADAEPNDKQYLDEDGLLHCKVCGEKLQTQINFQGKTFKVNCICDCGKADIERRKEKEHRQELERQRQICFRETNMATWTFENDDMENPKLSQAMKNYADGFADFRKDGKGLLLYGTVGTGKTYFAACIANRLIDMDYHVLMTNFAQLTNKISGMYEGKEEFIQSLNRYSLLIIDDLGVERNTEYMQEMVFNIIDSRYRSGLPFIITTNLTMEEITKAQSVGNARIYDRILERCFPVEVSGGSRRKKELKNSFADMKGRLGL